ncbi:hypothetical protein B0H63DRAFT_405400, partial [Podospora didyma]
VQPAAYSIAILRSYRRINLEIQNSWLSKILVVFLDPWTMFAKLNSLPLEVLSSLKQVHFVIDN